MTTCIGIVCIGDTYIREFEQTFKPSVVAYAQRHGYDLKIFTSYLDPAHAHKDCISFQKCLVPEALSQYDTVIVMDADIWMSDHAPRIPDCGDKVGIVNEAAQMAEYLTFSFVTPPIPYYASSGFELTTDKVLNTGFMVCKPQHHAAFLRRVYDTHIDKAIGHPRHFHYEQACIGYELQTHAMFADIPNAWNLIYLFYILLNRPPPASYGLHFAGIPARSQVLANYLVSRQLGQSRLGWGKL